MIGNGYGGKMLGFGDVKSGLRTGNGLGRAVVVGQTDGATLRTLIEGERADAAIQADA